MLKSRLDSLPGYPFARLRRLLEGIEPPAGVDPILMSIGEPQHPPPAIVAEVLAARVADWGKYPPLRGSAEFRRAVADWLTRRFDLPSGFIEPERHVLPVSGTREAIFMFAQVAVSRAEGSIPKPLVLVPNPL